MSLAALQHPETSLYAIMNTYIWHPQWKCMSKWGPRKRTLLQVDVQNIEHNKVRLPPFSSSAEPSPQPVCGWTPHWGIAHTYIWNTCLSRSARGKDVSLLCMQCLDPRLYMCYRYR